MRPATLVAGSVVCATLGAADLGVLSVVVVPRWLEPEAIERPMAKPPPSLPVAELPPKAEPQVVALPPPAVAAKAEPEEASPPKAEPPAKPPPTVDLPKVELANAAAEKRHAPEPPAARAAREPEEIDLSPDKPTAKEPSTGRGAAAATTVRFDLEKTDVGPEVRSQLNAVIAAAGAGDRFRVEGHADASGREEGNRYFSRERAKAVARELVHLGVAPSRISTSSFGSTRPVVAGRTAAAYERNRRVEIYLERSGR